MTRSPVIRPQATSPERPKDLLYLQGDSKGRSERPSDHVCEGSSTHESDDSLGYDVEDQSEGDADDEFSPEVGLAYVTENEGPAYGSMGDSEDVLAGILECFEDTRSPSNDSDTFDESPLTERQIGVTEDRQSLVANVPKTKRVLSYSTLTILNVDAGHSDDTLKRTKCSGLTEEPPSRLDFNEFSLGAPAMSNSFDRGEAEEHPSRLSCRAAFRERGNSCVSSDEEELDRQLEEELDECYDQSRENTPIPLLTPPASPTTLENQLIVCEWPSNLTIDNAMTAILTDVRPMSPQSLDDPDAEEDFFASPPKTITSSALTPLLRGISMNMA